MSAVCVVGDVVSEHGGSPVLVGHGVARLDSDDDDGPLAATQCGQVQRYNQLVLVEPAAGVYMPAVGHVVVGRVAQVEPSRWLVDIRSKTLAALPLSVAGGAVRRSAAQAAPDMRSVLAEGDLVAAEVQTVRADGQVQLHVRDAVASKLPPGMVVLVAPTLVPPQRRHARECMEGVRVVLGCNGVVWAGLDGDGPLGPAAVQVAVQEAHRARERAVKTRRALIPNHIRPPDQRLLNGC